MELLLQAFPFKSRCQELTDRWTQCCSTHRGVAVRRVVIQSKLKRKKKLKQISQHRCRISNQMLKNQKTRNSSQNPRLLLLTALLSLLSFFLCISPFPSSLHLAFSSLPTLPPRRSQQKSVHTEFSSAWSVCLVKAGFSSPQMLTQCGGLLGGPFFFFLNFCLSSFFWKCCWHTCNESWDNFVMNWLFEWKRTELTWIQLDWIKWNWIELLNKETPHQAVLGCKRHKPWRQRL